MMPVQEGSVQQKTTAGSSMIKKKAYSIQMSYEVSDAEKKQAEQALLCFSTALKLLQQAYDHLNIMKTPFKDNPEMTPDEVMKARVAIRRFRDKVIDNFNDFKEMGFRCVNAMQTFASDTQSVKLMKSMITAIDELEVKVNNFAEVFDDLQSKDFAKDVVSGIQSVQKQCDDIEEIIEERIKPHVQNEILATSWVDSISQDLQMKVEKQTPLIMDLYNKRQDQLNDAIKERGTQGN
jgi:hypothetical protein